MYAERSKGVSVCGSIIVVGVYYETRTGLIGQAHGPNQPAAICRCNDQPLITHFYLQLKAKLSLCSTKCHAMKTCA